MTYSTKQRQRGAASPRSKKIARLWCLARDLDMSEAMLRVVVSSVSGSDSISALTWPQLIQSIRALEIEKQRRKRRGTYERKKLGDAGVIFMPTPDQNAKIRSLLSDIDASVRLDDPHAYLDAVCRRTCGKNFRRITRSDAGKVIEALKSIQSRHAQKASS
jgi:hypothetical protein